jgi:transcriptional regulator with XRE-family HTH domain
MAKTTAPLLPTTSRLLQEVGERLRLARRRRRLQAKQVAERAGMNVMTLRAIERGSAGATMGAYASVMQVLQLERGLSHLAQDDPLGRQLQDKALDSRLKRRRLPSTRLPQRSPSSAATDKGHKPSSTIPQEGGYSNAVSSEDLLKLLTFDHGQDSGTSSQGKPRVHRRKPRKPTG